MTYVISDLHGYPLEKLKALLEKAGFGFWAEASEAEMQSAKAEASQSESAEAGSADDLYVLGDVIDRNGDGGIDVLRWIMEQPNVHMILGNHECMLLACRFLFEEVTDESLDALTWEQLDSYEIWKLNGCAPTVASLRKLTREQQADLLDFLGDLPLYEAATVGGRDYLFVHAGLGNFHPDKKMSEYTMDELVWTRPEPNTVYFDDVMTILGHTPTMLYGAMYKGRLFKRRTWMDIDAGAAGGLPPILLRLDDMEEFQLS